MRSALTWEAATAAFRAAFSAAAARTTNCRVSVSEATGSPAQAFVELS